MKVASRHLQIRPWKKDTLLLQTKMEKVINLHIPHVGEQIFENIDTDDLIKWFMVSETWRILAGNVLLKRWKNKMIEACQHGKSQIVKLLLERTDTQLDTRDNHGWTAFMVACYNGHKDIVKMLLNCSDKNIELNASDNLGFTGFQLACFKGHKDIVKLLLKHSDKNIELNTANSDGRTAFMSACFNGHEDVVKLLLNCSDKNIELNARDNN